VGDGVEDRRQSSELFEKGFHLFILKIHLGPSSGLNWPRMRLHVDGYSLQNRYKKLKGQKDESLGKFCNIQYECPSSPHPSAHRNLEEGLSTSPKPSNQKSSRSYQRILKIVEGEGKVTCRLHRMVVRKPLLIRI
jgi:hypothetical protein